MPSATTLLGDVAERAIAAALAPPLEDNVDQVRFPDGMRERSPEQAEARLRHLLAHAEDWEWLAARLDPASRELLLDRLVFHVVGHRHARIGPDAATVRALVRFAREQLVVEHEVTRLRFAGSSASDRFDLAPLGLPIVLESYLLGVQGTFQLEQYACPHTPQARPRPGDVAIDAGGCFGETALWLASRVGPTGRVLSLEFTPGNLTLLHANLAGNPELAARIRVSESALWERGGATLPVTMDGPASSIVAEHLEVAADARVARTVAVDELLADGILDRLDFLKMDIEGAEPAALRGAETTLRRFRPRLALAAYHAIDHAWQLARQLDGLELGYRFALGHFTMHEEETVLYAWAS